MDQHTIARPVSPSRAPLAGVSALLVFGLLMSVSLSAVKPAVGESRRDPVSERVAVRQISASLVKAVRRLAAADRHNPCATMVVRPAGEGPTAPSLTARTDGVRPAPALLRAAILDLPPPARAA